MSHHTLPDTGFLRISEVLKYIPISKTTFWNYIHQGKFPHPVKLGVRASAWKVEDVRKLIDDLSQQKNPEKPHKQLELNFSKKES